MLTFKPKETLTEQVAQHIENMIAFNRLKSGQRIFEAAMAKELNVSHGSVREALLVLEKRHLVRSIPRRGAFVTELDDKFVRSLYEVLLVYLTYTGRKFLENCTDEDIRRLESLYLRMQEHYSKGQVMPFLELALDYIQTSIGYADNYFITTAIQDLWPSAKRCAFVVMKQGKSMLEDALEHVRESLEANKRRDVERVIRIFESYVNNQCEQVLAALNHKP